MNPCVKMVCLALGSSLGAWAAAPEISSFEIDPRLQIELFAAEPDVVDPVALTFDAAGRMYVVEMRDYPYGVAPGNKPGGTVRLLEDTDGDDRADKSTLFARDLSFPTSIAPWEGGVFVTAPPDILYLKDTNADGVADVREVYFTGFFRGVTDGNVNGLRWGLDNRIHGVNGGSGGTIKPQKGTRIPIELEHADFSFDPRNGDFTKTYETSGGFGLVFDEFGRSFSTHNINHIQQRIIPLRYLDRFPGMLPIEPTQSISDHEEMARIFSISVARTRPNHPEQAGHFSSSGGLGFIGYDAYPGDLYRSITVGDVVGNLIHRDLLETNGAVFVARRSPSEAQREFIASRDGACRLTGLELGPDGALYAIDMQRDVIEHPDYIPEKVRATLNIRAGEDRGRIYRITPKEGLPRDPLDLSKAHPRELVGLLGHGNQWRRQTAQRLLVEQRQDSMTHPIAQMAAKHASPLGQVHALWTLVGLGKLDMSTASSAMHSVDPGVRENAVQIMEQFSRLGRGARGSLGDAWMRGFEAMLPFHRVNSPPRVRLQLALTLGEFDTDQAKDNLHQLLLMNRESYWIRMAVYSSLRMPIEALLEVLRKLPANAGAGDFQMLRELADLSIVRTDHPASTLTEMLTAIEKHPADVAVPVIEGIERGFARNGLPPQRLPIQPQLSRLAEKSGESFLAIWSLSKRLGLAQTPRQREMLGKAVTVATNSAAPRADRLRALGTLRFGDYKTVRDPLLGQLSGQVDAQVQSEAFRVLSTFRENDLAQELVKRWSELAPDLRVSVLNLMLSRRAFHDALVTGIEKETLKLGELNLDLEQRRILLRQGAPEIRARSAKFISDEEYSNRKQVVDDWFAKLPADGDAAKGRTTFEKVCAQCHRAGGLGHNVGPDLTSISHRSVEDILFNILDPNMAINPKYAAYQVETKEGELLAGILEQNSSESVSLLQASEAKVTVPRANIKSIRTTGTSLMPEGLEAGLSAADLRDLIAFLQQPQSN